MRIILNVEKIANYCIAIHARTSVEWRRFESVERAKKRVDLCARGGELRPIELRRDIVRDACFPRARTIARRQKALHDRFQRCTVY